jgi:hypothetical protein
MTRTFVRTVDQETSNSPKEALGDAGVGDSGQSADILSIVYILK